MLVSDWSFNERIEIKMGLRMVDLIHFSYQNKVWMQVWMRLRWKRDEKKVGVDEVLKWGQGQCAPIRPWKSWTAGFSYLPRFLTDI